MVAAFWPAIAHGQTTFAPSEPDPATVRVRVGPLWISPTLSLANVGVDTNVFNVAESDNPQSDFTIAATPSASLWLHVGRTWVSSVIKEDFVWYQKFESERSVNSNYSLGYLVPLTRMTFTVGTNWLNTRERPGFEIDARSQRSERVSSGAVELRALSKTLIGVRAERRTVDFDQEAEFLGTSLHDQLNRTESTAALTLRYELTSLTSVTLDASMVQDRFVFEPLRDSDSTQVAVGVRFDPDAVISGSAQFGYRDFKPLASDLPGYSGATVSANVASVIRGATKMSLHVTRDVEYSFDIDAPYYLLTALSGSIVQQVFGPVDVEARVGRQRLAYTVREGAAIELAGRVDVVRSYGAGVGYHLGRDVRWAFNVDQQSRTSGVDGRSYSGLRYGTAVTYVF